MSIRGVIASRRDEGRLCLLQPAMPGSPCVRWMFVSPEIFEAIDGPWNDSNEGYRFGRLRADLDAFIEGRLISIGKHPYKKNKKAYMSQLDPVVDEVWEIRSIDPKPGIRVFGSFSEKDTFVALTWLYRAPLMGPNSREWRDAREQCKAEWRNLFITYKPHTGADLENDYASNAFLV